MKSRERTEVLDCYVFYSLQEDRVMSADGLYCYNNQQPHDVSGAFRRVQYRVKKFPTLYF